MLRTTMRAAARTSLRGRARRARTLSTAADADGADGSPLAGTDTRGAIHKSFEQRAADALRYEYFAQRAELEAEVEAAHMFRALLESSKQQAMGFLELMEEYDDAEFGTTLNNLELMADAERTLADERFYHAGRGAEREQLPHVREWFEDLSDAAARAANRLEFTASMLDAEALEGDDMEHDDEPSVDASGEPSVDHERAPKR